MRLSVSACLLLLALTAPCTVGRRPRRGARVRLQNEQHLLLSSPQGPLEVLTAERSAGGSETTHQVTMTCRVRGKSAATPTTAAVLRDTHKALVFLQAEGVHKLEQLPCLFSTTGNLTASSLTAQEVIDVVELVPAPYYQLVCRDPGVQFSHFIVQSEALSTSRLVQIA